MNINEAMQIFNIHSLIPEKELRVKYKKLCNKNHPDKGGDEQTMKNINIAYEILKKSQIQPLDNLHNKVYRTDTSTTTVVFPDGFGTVGSFTVYGSMYF